jgi:hypothetical protein
MEAIVMDEVYINKKPSPEFEAWLQQAKQNNPELVVYYLRSIYRAAEEQVTEEIL